MPEMYNPSSNSDQEQLLFGGSTTPWYSRLMDHKKAIIGVCSILGLITLAVIVTVSLLSTKADVVVPTTPTPFVPTTTSMPTTTTSKTTTTTPTTTTTAATTTTKPTTTTTKTTTTTEPTTTTTTEPTTSTTTTEEPTTLSTLPTSDPPTSAPFHPTTLHPLPSNATDVPPVNLLYQMDMRPNFTQIQCLQHYPPTFKFQVTVLDNHTYIGEDQSRKEDAKTSSARVANEALFDIKYPKPMPSPAQFPCQNPSY